MLSELAVVGCGRIVERVVGPVHKGVLAEHGSHFCGFEDVEEGFSAQVSSEKYGGGEWDAFAVCDDGIATDGWWV